MRIKIQTTDLNCDLSVNNEFYSTLDPPYQFCKYAMVVGNVYTFIKLAKVKLTIGMFFKKVKI